MVSQRVNTTKRLAFTHSALGDAGVLGSRRSAPQSLMLAVDVNGYQDSGCTEPPQLWGQEVREGFLEEVALL